MSRHRRQSLKRRRRSAELPVSAAVLERMFEKAWPAQGAMQKLVKDLRNAPFNVIGASHVRTKP